MASLGEKDTSTISPFQPERIMGRRLVIAVQIFSHPPATRGGVSVTRPLLPLDRESATQRATRRGGSATHPLLPLDRGSAAQRATRRSPDACPEPSEGPTDR